MYRKLKMPCGTVGYSVCALLYLLTVLPLSSGTDNTQDICNRDPPQTAASRTPGDNGFQIKIVGNPQPERYIPEQVYTIVINGTYPNQLLLGFMLVAVPLNAQDETTQMGTFQHMSSGVTEFAPDCPHVVTHSYTNQKAGVEVLWTAPPAGTGCVEFRATVVEYVDIWYRDDGALTRVFCEETASTDKQTSPDALPECCACGTAKYQMTFEGTWSRRTHPKDFPNQKRLLHWSNIVGASHSKHYDLWRYGGTASQGVKQVCEFGYTRILEQEMRDHSRDVRTVVKTPGIWWNDPHGLEQTRWARFSVDRKNHLVSMLTMLGPSPDWCVGISATNLCLPNCSWTGDIEFKLMPWDAGTDDGITYMAPNKASNPPQTIQEITNTLPNSPDAPFYGPDPIKPLATIKIRRIHPKAGDPQVCTGQEEEPIEGIEISEDLPEGMEGKLMPTGKCAMSDWAEWSECSVTCGVGQRFRKRMYLISDMDETMCGQPTMESENCIGIENECEGLEDECAVTRWSDFSPCSATCGKGTRMRRRGYYREADAKVCHRQLEEKEVCMADILDCSKAIAMLNFTDICSQEVSYGKCRADFQRFHFDTKMGKCLPFSYTGCRGNRNNFLTEDDCMTTCLPVMKAAMMAAAAASPTTPGFDINKQQEDEPTSLCALPSEVGPCRASYTRYHFDKDMLKCLPFTFGGCQGNGNNFLSEEVCMDQCFMAMKQDLMERQAKAQEAGGLGDPHVGPPTEPAPTEEAGKKEGKREGKKNGHKKDKKNKEKKGKSDPNKPHKVDCMVTEWTEWSDCSATCGRGYKDRQRMVKREPEHGGKKCPKKLTKKKRCKLPKCQSDKEVEKTMGLEGHDLQDKKQGQGQRKKHARKSAEEASVKNNTEIAGNDTEIAGNTSESAGQGDKMESGKVQGQERKDKGHGQRKQDQGKGQDQNVNKRQDKGKRKSKRKGEKMEEDITNKQSKNETSSQKDHSKGDKGQSRGDKGQRKGDKVQRKVDKGQRKGDKGQRKGDKGQRKGGKGQGKEEKVPANGRKSEQNAKNDTAKSNDNKSRAKKEKGPSRRDKGQIKPHKGQTEMDKGQNKTEKGQIKATKGQAKTDKGEEVNTTMIPMVTDKPQEQSGNNGSVEERRKDKKKPEDGSKDRRRDKQGRGRRREERNRESKKNKKHKKNSSQNTTNSTVAEVGSRNETLKVRNCVITDWSEWSHCSVTCGRGYQYKRRIIEEVEKNGGRACPSKLEQKRRCILPKCVDERCKMSPWGPWTPCPKTCGTDSIQERTRTIEHAPNGDVSLCGPRIERRFCTLPPCLTQRGRSFFN